MDVPVRYVAPPPAPPPVDDFIELPGELSPLQTALRHKWKIAAFALAVAVATYAVVKQIPSVYTSDAQVAFNVDQIKILGENSAFSGTDLSDDVMQTEMAALASPEIGRQVVRELGLENLKPFMKCERHGGLGATLSAMVGGPSNETCTPDLKTATSELIGSVMTFTNDHQSYVVRIAASTHDEALSARIANTYAQAFIDWRIGNHDQRAAQADKWLSGYIATLREKMVAANDAVETYRIQHHLVGVGPTAVGSGPDTVTNQRLSQLNAQLSEIDADLASHTSTLQETGGDAMSSATAMSNPVVQSLLERRAETSATLSSLRARYGDDHPRVLAAQAELNRINGQLGREVSRSVTGLRGEVRALQGRRAAIQAQVDRLETGVAGESQSDVRLDELQREADTENELYRNMLGRMRDIDADRHTEMADASIVVPAEPAGAPSSPHRAMLVAGAFLASLGIGAGLAFARELTARRFRDIRHLESETGLPVLGLFARAPRGTTPRDLVLDKPFSAESEMLHAVLARLEQEVDRSAGGRAMLITSALPAEGKSSFGVALGRLASQAGLRTILVDGDLRRSSLAGMMGEADETARPPGHELVRFDAISTDPRSGLALLSLASVVGNARRIVAARGLGELLSELRGRYDLIIIDTPPVLAVPDTESLAAFVDEVVMVVDWTQQQRDTVRAAIGDLRRARAHLAGIVVSKLGLKDYAAISASPVHDLRRYREYLPRVAA